MNNFIYLVWGDGHFDAPLLLYSFKKLAIEKEGMHHKCNLDCLDDRWQVKGKEQKAFLSSFP